MWFLNKGYINNNHLFDILTRKTIVHEVHKQNQSNLHRFQYYCYTNRIIYLMISLLNFDNKHLHLSSFLYWIFFSTQSKSIGYDSIAIMNKMYHHNDHHSWFLFSNSVIQLNCFALLLFYCCIMWQMALHSMQMVISILHVYIWSKHKANVDKLLNTYFANIKKNITFVKNIVKWDCVILQIKIVL